MTEQMKLGRGEELLLELIGLLVLTTRARAAMARGQEVDEVLRPGEMQIITSTSYAEIQANYAEATKLYGRIGIDFDGHFQAAIADIKAKHPGAFEYSPVVMRLQ